MSNDKQQTYRLLNPGEYRQAGDMMPGRNLGNKLEPILDFQIGWPVWESECVLRPLQPCQCEELRKALEAVLASATPNKQNHPTMFAAWQRAKEVLEK